MSKNRVEVFTKEEIFKKEEIISQIRELCQKDFAFFLFNFVKTFDFDTNNSRRPFPQEKVYEILAEELQREKFICIAKSRQLLVTWLICSYVVWKCLFNSGFFAVVKSTKYDKSGWGASDNQDVLIGDTQALLSRCYHIYSNLPDFLRIPIITSKRPALIKFIHEKEESQSIIIACTSNPDELRQYSINLLFIDEVAFQKDAKLAYYSTLPSLTQNGQVIFVSTPNGKNFFYNILYDLEK